MAKRDLETMKNQLQMKDKIVANNRLEASKLRKENVDLKKEVKELNELILDYFWRIIMDLWESTSN